MRFIVFLSLFSVLLISSCTQNEENVRVVRKFTHEWKFNLLDSLENDSGYYRPDLDDSKWRVLNLPHDWSIEGTFSPDHPADVGGGALPGGVGWYRKSFSLPENDRNKKVFIDFDGVYMNSEVWINGHYLGKRPYGYISFRYDLTPHLNFGDKENVLAVKVDNSLQPNSRWYSGAGIYRNVWLTTVNPLYVDHWGTFITTPHIEDDRAVVHIQSTVSNDFDQPVVCTVITQVVSPEGEVVAQTESADKELLPNQKITFSDSVEVPHPVLWDLNQPRIYTAITRIWSDGHLMDQYHTKFGIRSFNFDAEKGFFLNGRPVKIKGVCLHHDLGALGAAFNRRAMERQLQIMQKMGVNAIRTSHNPPAPEVLQLCDSMGFIVMDEAFDMWALAKVKYDYSHHWEEWHETDLRDFIRRDRNHPSVMIWSIGNEILEQWDSSGVELTRELAAIVRQLDPTRPITTGNNEPSPRNYLIQSGALDLIGVNYHHEGWTDFPKTFPGQKFIATETNSSLHTRGYYDMPSDSVRVWPNRWDVPFEGGNPGNTCSAYDNCRAPWGSTHADTWRLIKKYDFLSGMFIWTGFDYLGEPTPYQWPSRSSYFGVVDLAGFPKDAYYFYQSEWSKDTVLHLFPHWNWEEGQTVDVWAYYNYADEVELFLNDKSLGSKSKSDEQFHVMWRVSFEPGTLRAVSRKNGQRVAEKIIHTAGQPARIHLTCDREIIHANGEDLAFVTAIVTDKEGVPVPDAENLIKFSLDGEASIVATDNGSQTSLTSFQSHQRKAFHGKCLAIVRAGSKKGSVMVKAVSEGLPEAVARIELQ
ncbi:beta-galactosidase GalB [Thermophagus sp. OGC60D27]|uniref:beta-galactosidase GalB n=1 Tax=Thermophagus sp. OGC60D27 TaxID=3458415 RepID=UPI004037A0FF